MRATVLPLSAFLITKYFCLRKLRETFNSSLEKLFSIFLLLKLSKKENAVSKIFDLTALVWEIDKLLLLISPKKAQRQNKGSILQLIRWNS